MIDNMSFFKKLTAGHYKIERFGVIFMLLLCLMFLDIGFIIQKISVEDSQMLSDRALYTTSFTTSRTGQTGMVEHLYTNENNDRIFLLLHFDDMTSMSTNAANYQMFLTASDMNRNNIQMTVDPDGLIFVFGSTGYMGIYLVEAGGFDAQILNLVIRCNQELTSSDSTATDNPDGSFANYDQIQIYFNPAGAEAEHAAFLDSDETVSVSSVYEEAIVRQSEMELRDALAADLEILRQDMNLIVEYAARVQQNGILLPEYPEDMAGDRILDQDGNVIASLTGNDLDAVTVTEDTVFYLDSDYTMPGGVSLDWQDKWIRDGYLNDLKGDLTSSQFMSNLAQDSRQLPSLNFTWYNLDGTEWIYNSSLNLSEDRSRQQSIDQLTDALRQYRSDKNKYEVTDSVDLLRLEAELMSSSTQFTMNDSESVLTNY